MAILSAVYPTSPTISAPITSLVISWQPSAQVATPPYTFAPSGWYPNCNSVSGPCFPAVSQWSSNSHPYPGVIRLALTPLNNGPLPTNDTSLTYTSFLYPVTTSGTAQPYSPTTIGAYSGTVAPGNCSNGTTQLEACNVSIDVSQANVSNFLMELRSIYNSSQVTITAYNHGTQLLFRNAQTIIDSTGDDQGVLKRIQVRLPGLNDTGFPAYDLGTSNRVCKNLIAWPTNQSTNYQGQVTNLPCHL